MDNRYRIIVALDESNIDVIKAIIEETKQYVGWYKIGLELIAGQKAERVIDLIKLANAKVFYDIKLNDIPTTVARSVRAAKSLGIDLINMHATAGYDAMVAAVQEANGQLEVAAVTVLTSMNNENLRQLRFDMSGYQTEDDAVGALVCDLARVANKAGVRGLISSPTDLAYLRTTDLFDKFVKITPGIRPSWAASNDQKRILTPKEAVLAGSDMMVIGRPITSPPAPLTRGEAALKVYVDVWN